MCGICGIINFKDSSRVSDGALRNMCDALKHRGPDGEGAYIANREKPLVMLGHRRLKIIDLSEAGHQPMKNEDGSIWIVFNGEIYNYKELRAELERKGHLFISNTDTETVIHLYEEYHENCVNYLRGMFAFSIWDERKKSLFLARDRVGKKPLLYSYADGIFCFASEFLSLLASGLIKKEINYDSIHQYITFGYVPAPLTIYKGVYKLLPAHRLTLENGDIRTERYWQLNYSNKIRISEDEAVSELLRLLKEAVKIRLYSDVPLGAFLSGGIDSSTIVALMSSLTGNKVKTFSIGFQESGYNELKYAKIIADKFNTEHNEFIVKPNALEILPLLIERYGEPYADSSCIPTYYVSQQTRKFVTVALNGDGGDELFGGYERYQAMLAADIYQKLPSLLKKPISGILRRLPDSVNNRNLLRNIRRVSEALNLSMPQRYLRWISMFDSDLKNHLYSDNFRDRVSKKDPLDHLMPYLEGHEGLSLTDRLLMTDTNTYLPEDLLVKVDITSMANSLEARSPFLDHKLMEFAASLPAEYKIRRLIDKKHILKKAMKGVIPSENVNRRKMGFGVPVGSWFRNELRGLLCETLLSKTSFGRGYFKPEVLKNIVRKHIKGKSDYSFQLWTLLMLELWHRKFID